MKDLILIAIFFVLVSFIFFIFLFLLPLIREEKTYKGNAVKTVAVREGRPAFYNSASDVNYSYYVNDKKLLYTGTSLDYSVIGDKYQIIYDSKDPYNVDLDYSSPIFLPEEKTNNSTGTVFNLTIFGDYRSLVFTYQIDNILYYREQGIPQNFKEKYPNVTEGQKYEIEYWVENPQRSIMYFDQPIDESK